MRVLGSKQNTLKLNDNISGSELELYYRQPSTKERQAYQAQAFPRKGSKVKVNLVATQIKFGKRIITGFEEGNFGMIEDGKTVVFSADPDSKNYRKDWKDLLEKHASDILMILAAQVFDAPTEIDEPDDDDELDFSLEEDIEGNLPETSQPSSGVSAQTKNEQTA